MLIYSMLPSGLLARGTLPPKKEEVKVWHKIPQRDLLREVRCPTDVPVGKGARIYQ